MRIEWVALLAAFIGIVLGTAIPSAIKLLEIKFSHSNTVKDKIGFLQKIIEMVVIIEREIREHKILFW